MNDKLPAIGIIGAGRLGVTLARILTNRGYQVNITTTKDPKSLELILKVLAPKSAGNTIEDAIHQSQVIILAFPLHAYKSLIPTDLVGKIVIDAMNYWPQTEGKIAEFELESISSSEIIQNHLRDAIVIKSLNHVAYNELEEHSLPKNAPARRAIALAGEDKNAVSLVSNIINDIGFDPVYIGGLAQGIKLQPNTPIFNTRLKAEDIQKLI